MSRWPLMHNLPSLQIFANTTPRPGLHPIPGSVPLTVTAAVLPPLIYYLALLLLAPPPPPAVASSPVIVLRNSLALIAGVLFFRLPLVYHVPQSIGLTYQLGLVGLYGGFRVLDAFFISPYLFHHIPRRVKYHHRPRTEPPDAADKERERQWTNGGVPDPFHHEDETQQRAQSATSPGNGGARRLLKSDFPEDKTISTPFTNVIQSRFHMSALRRSISGPSPVPVYETAITEVGWPVDFLDRASWALELELSMRGIGFTWTTADVRHTRKTWLPTVYNRLHSIVVHVLPVLFASWLVIRSIYRNYALPAQDTSWDTYSADDLFDERIPLPFQLLLTLALGSFLMAAFSFGHSLFAILLHPLAPSPLAFFPPLYTTRVWNITSVRHFWSFGWHRLFARLFLVYGVWPGEWLERKIFCKTQEQPADVGKVIGAFLISGFVHSFSVRGVLAGDWRMATGEAVFFAFNGLAVVLEGAIVKAVVKMRNTTNSPVSMWYDPVIGRVWWISVLLWTGRNFARGWVKSNLVREMSFM